MKKLVLLALSLTLVACKYGIDSNNRVSEKETVLEKRSAPEKESVPDSTKSAKHLKEELVAKGFEIFDYVDPETKDTILMQKYFIAFLKSGPKRSQGKEEADSLQTLHLAHLAKMYKEGFADISGPFGDDGDIRGITIYNVPSQEMADSLAHADPMVKSGRLVIEVHPWWAAKGFSLR